jgi:molybdate transport system substrate-binding protein
MYHLLSSVRFLALAILSLTAGCTGGNLPDGPAEEVLVFAAASTTNAVEEICRDFEREYGVRARASFAATSTLAQQIINGAEAHVLVSANQSWVDHLDSKNLVARRRDLLGNRLVVIVPAESRLTIREPKDLSSARIEHVAIADPDSAPAGIYAREALTNLEIWDALESKIVAAPDVRRALVHVENATVEAGIVYATDAAISGRVRVVFEIPPELTTPIRYPIVLLRSGSGNLSAERFFEYLSSSRAASVFRKHGFVAPAGPEPGGQ